MIYMLWALSPHSLSRRYAAAAGLADGLFLGRGITGWEGGRFERKEGVWELDNATFALLLLLLSLPL